MEKFAKASVAALLAASLLSGCGLILAGTAGGVAATELEEDDGTFDPLENTAVGEPIEDAGEAVGEVAEDVGEAAEDAYEEVVE